MCRCDVSKPSLGRLSLKLDGADRMGFGAGALGTKLFPLLLTMQLSPFLLMRILVFFDNALWLCVDEVEATVGAVRGVTGKGMWNRGGRSRWIRDPKDEGQ